MHIELVKILSSFSKCLSHPNELLIDHLSGVSKSAIRNAEGTTDRIEKAVLLMGLMHDVGKGTRWFQERISGKTREKDRRSHHAQLSTLFANHVISNLPLSKEEKEWLKYTVSIGIAKHHSNIVEGLMESLDGIRQEARYGNIFQEQMDSFAFEDFDDWLNSNLANQGFNSILNVSPKLILGSLKNISPPIDKPFTTEKDGIEFLIAWGSLLGADKICAALPDWATPRHSIRPEIVSEFIIESLEEKESSLNALRNQIFKEIEENLKNNLNSNFYTITAPTGSGKTLSGLMTGLILKQAKEKTGPSRIIYCLPFTSIIDQNSEVYRKVLEFSLQNVDTDILLKHHHLADVSYKIGDEYVEDGGDLLVETWQSEIVVTTFHQLVDTLFSSRNKSVKRISALKNSVIILDEVQAIPYEYWNDIYKMFKHISQIMNTTFVLMTATMPLIIPKEDSHELLPSHQEHYKRLARTQLINQTDEKIKFDELVDCLNEEYNKEPDISRILILNRRGIVRDFYSLFKKNKENVIMLSTDLTPKDRYDILSKLTKPFTLVTTQLIEAGVDISANEVWRDIAPLDSIIQSAGRCNRNSEKKSGQVRLIKMIDDEDKLVAIPPYDPFLIQTTQEVLSKYGNVIDESDFHQLSQDYYNLLKSRSEQANVMRHFASGDIHKLNDKDEGLRLIKEIPRQSYFIIQNDEDRTIWESYLKLDEESDLLERRRKFRSFKREFMERMVNQIDKDATSEILPIYPEDKRYGPRTGLKPGNSGYEFI